MTASRANASLLARNKGFSLIELMVAMVLGIIIVAGAASVYIASKNSLTEVEQVAVISENGRFALQTIGFSLRHAGFFGSANPNDINEDANLGVVTNDCTDGAQAYDLSTALFAQRATSNSLLTCINDALPNTDVLVVKGVQPSAIYDADPDDISASRDGTLDFPAGAWNVNMTYIVSNSESGLLVDGADTIPSVAEGEQYALAAAWPYRMEIFYIRNTADGPALARKNLAWDSGTSTMSIDTQDLVFGVENMRFLFGFDSTNNGEMDTMGDLAAVNAAQAWDEVTSIQVFLLLRSAAPDFDYRDDKTYRLGDLSITPGDNFRRVMLQSEFTLRNRRLVLRGGA